MQHVGPMMVFSSCNDQRSLQVSGTVIMIRKFSRVNIAASCIIVIFSITENSQWSGCLCCIVLFEKKCHIRSHWLDVPICIQYKIEVTVQLSISVFKAGRPSTSWTAAHLLHMSPAFSVFALPVATNSLFHNVVATSSVVGHSLLSACGPETLCLTISATNT